MKYICIAFCIFLLYSCSENSVRTENRTDEKSVKSSMTEELIDDPISAELIIAPNPASIYVSVNFEITYSCKLKIRLENPLGNVISEVFNNYVNVGNHALNIDVDNLKTGYYFIHLLDDYGNSHRRLFKVVRD